jgi:hypothetical protein
VIFTGTKIRDDQSVPRKYVKAALLLPDCPDYLLTFGLSTPVDQKHYLLSETKTEQLSNRLELEIARYNLRKKIYEEEILAEKRKKMLKETYSIVTKLRETVQTATTGLSSIESKIQKIKEEKKKISVLFHNLKGKINDCSSEEKLQWYIKEALGKVNLIETSTWEEEIAPLRTRFLMQKEEEQIPETPVKEGQKRKTLPLTDKENLNEKIAEKNKSQEQGVVTIVCYYHKKKRKELSQKIQQNNKLVRTIGIKLSAKKLLSTKEQLTQILKNCEKKNFEIGSQIFKLKKEQATLSYEARQTIVSLRTSLMNIGGVLGTRNFLKEGINNLRAPLIEETTFRAKKQNVLANIHLILQVVGQLEG